MDYSVPIVEEHYSEDSCRIVTGQLKPITKTYNCPLTQVSLNNLAVYVDLLSFPCSPPKEKKTYMHQKVLCIYYLSGTMERK